MKKLCMKLYNWLDPNVIDWCYFKLGSEWLCELVGTISGKLYDWGSK